MKKGRQEKILELITRYEIETQDELIEFLGEEGYNVTQATISRDIKTKRNRFYRIHKKKRSIIYKRWYEKNKRRKIWLLKIIKIL